MAHYTLALWNQITGQFNPLVDFCFRDWDTANSYFGAECKNLYERNPGKIKRYIETGVCNYTNGRYGSQSTHSSLIGYVLSGSIPNIVDQLKAETIKKKPVSNLIRNMAETNPQYKSVHIRDSDGNQITLHHLFFDFVA